MEQLKKNWKECLYAILFLLSCIAFAIPSITYLLEHKTLENFKPYFKFLLNDSPTHQQTFIYIIILTLMTIFYFLIIKNRKKLFENKKGKSLIVYLIIIAIIFVFVVPFTSSDVFYYLGIGRLNNEYGQNPYYTSVKDFVEQNENQKYLEKDTALSQGYFHYWSDATVVYGPIWSLICNIIGGLSFGNVDIGILLFKLLNILVHFLNCYFIYKLTNKKIFLLIYGINPFVLIEGISNAHNDIIIVLFVLISIYFLIKKKKLTLSLIFLALATTIKYFTVLLLPFFIIYYFRKEKPNIRLIKCIKFGILFFIIVAIPYLIYIKDLKVLSGIFIQQNKIAKSLYVVLSQYFNNIPNVVNYTKKFLLTAFILIYFFTCINLIIKKEIKFRAQMQTYQKFLTIFIFFLITNFQPWYIFWLFPCIMWQNSRQIKMVARSFYCESICK